MKSFGKPAAQKPQPTVGRFEQSLPVGGPNVRPTLSPGMAGPKMKSGFGKLAGKIGKI